MVLLIIATFLSFELHFSQLALVGSTLVKKPSFLKLSSVSANVTINKRRVKTRHTYCISSVRPPITKPGGASLCGLKVLTIKTCSKVQTPNVYTSGVRIIFIVVTRTGLYCVSCWLSLIKEHLFLFQHNPTLQAEM